MAQTVVERLKVLENQNFMSVLTLPIESVDKGTLEFLNLWKTDEMAKIKEQILAN